MNISIKGKVIVVTGAAQGIGRTLALGLAAEGARVAVLARDQALTAAETTWVIFSDMTDDDIAAYIATGEPMDKAGAYAIQGRAAQWIPRIEGEYSNVVGLPLARLAGLLKSLAPSG